MIQQFYSRYILKGISNIYLYKYLYMNVRHSIIHSAKRCKQSKCLSIDEWMSKLWSLCTTEYCTAITMNEAVIHARRWNNIENIIINERSSQSQRTNLV